MPDFPESHFLDDLENVISFFTEDIDFELAQSTKIEQWIKQVIEREKSNLININYIFCSDAYLHQLNVDYLEHDTLTDIITFPYNDPPQIQGDIFISINRVRENTRELKLLFQRELHRVIIHGVLHLCGYGDKSEEEAKLMRQKEEEMLDLLESMT